MYLLFYSVCSSLLIYVLTYKLQIYVYYFIIFYLDRFVAMYLGFVL